MSSVLIEKDLFYHGAEQYQNIKWELFTNISRYRAKHTDICIEQAGVVCKLTPDAYDNFGKPLTNSLAIMIPVGLEQTEQLNLYGELSVKLGHLYGERLEKAGIAPEGFFGWKNLPYIGCEEEYGFLQTVAERVN